MVKEWKLKKSARCYNCGDATIQDVEIDQYNLIIKCRECGFTRYYAFHMVDIPHQCEV